jgi:hypothetical protein
MGNKTIVSIPISYDQATPIVQKEFVPSNYFVKVNKDNIFSNMSAFFPVGTFEDFDMNFDVKGDTLYLHDDSVPFIVILPLQSKTINTLHYKRKKMFIADVDKVGRLGYNATTIKGNVLVLEHVLWATLSSDTVVLCCYR